MMCMVYWMCDVCMYVLLIVCFNLPVKNQIMKYIYISFDLNLLIRVWYMHIKIYTLYATNIRRFIYEVLFHLHLLCHVWTRTNEHYKGYSFMLSNADFDG